MHEVRVSAPHGKSEEVAQLALKSGISEATVYEVYVHGPDRRRQVISVETATPLAKKFVDELFAADWFNTSEYHITTRELRSIIASSERVRDVTRPMVEPALDVLQDLWQLNHVTPSYVGRAAGGAVLLAYGMFKNSAIAIVVAAMFVPFLSEVLAIAFGGWGGDRRLAGQGSIALLVSVVMSVCGGAAVALLHGGPMQYSDFQSPLVAFGISSVIGVAAGLATADDAGRRYLISVAASVQYAVFPVWFGTCLILGWPDRAIIIARLTTFVVNIVTISVTAGIVYALIGMRKEDASHYRSKVEATEQPGAVVHR